MQRKQLELSGVSRKRHTLSSEAVADLSGGPVLGELKGCGDVTLDVEAFIGYSPWVKFSDSRPPCSGFWDVKDDGRRLGEVRACYNLERDMLTLPSWPFPISSGGCSWRGLKSPYPGHDHLDDSKGPRRPRRVIESS